MPEPAKPTEPDAATASTTDPPDLTDEQRLAGYAAALADGIVAALPAWVEASVDRIADAWQVGLAASLRPAAAEAGAAAAHEVGADVRALLALDVDQQAAGPLALIRAAVVHPTRVLADAGVGPVRRDEFAERAFPADVYDLAPASFADLDPALREPGLHWGAAKAHVVLSRRKAEGRR